MSGPCECGSHHFWSRDGINYFCSRCRPMPRSATHTRVEPNPPDEDQLELDQQVWERALKQACEHLSISPDQLDAMVHPDEKPSAAYNVKQLVAFAESYLRHSSPPKPKSVNSWRPT